MAGSGLLPKHVQDVSLGNLDYDGEFKPSLTLSTRLKKWLKTIFSDTGTRNLFLFLLLNLSFAFVELLWGMWTNSLGLISDSFHMFFDCTALLAGLVATVVARWPPNDRFSFGYVRAEVVAGFVNTLFLLFVAFFIFAEAIERSFEPPTVSHDRLMIVSIAGFVVNLVGLFAFQHGGHGHSHGGSHGHSHGGRHGHSHGDDHSQMHRTSHGHTHSGDHGYLHSGHNHNHTHSHIFDDSDHQHNSHTADSKIMQGIFLHILADTLGSVGVIISSALIHQFGWMIADPLCSMFIAVLIIMSIIPLMRDSLGVLMQRAPPALDYILPNCLQKVYELEGVVQLRDTHFWTLCSGNYYGSVRLDMMQGSDIRRTLELAKTILTEAGIQHVVIEINLTD